MANTKKHTKNKKRSSYKNQKVKRMPGLEFKPDYVKSVSEPWFTLIALGIKKVEGRLDKGSFSQMESGNIVEWTNSDFGMRKVITRITRKTKYASFREYLEAEGLSNCLPGITSVDMGVAIYHKYYEPVEEVVNGVLAIELEVLMVKS